MTGPSAVLHALEAATGIDAGGRGGDGCRWGEPLPLPIQASVERRDQLPFKVPVRGYLGILSGASKAERKAAPKHINNVSYPGLRSIEQHI